VNELWFGPAGLSGSDWIALFGHFVVFSLLSIGGAISVAPEMHRVVVGQQGWITDAQFTTSVALAQAAPGPNLLFVQVVGHAIAGMPGALVALAGILLPSTTLALVASRWGHQRREMLGVRAFVAGMAPVTIGLLLAAGTVLAQPYAGKPSAWVLIAVAVALSARTKINPVWLIAGGAGVGAGGWV
jgi:chromate transporter